MQHPAIDKIMHEIDRMKNTIGMLQAYIAGLEHRMNAQAYALNLGRPGAHCAGGSTKQVMCPPPDSGTGNRSLLASPAFRNTDGSTNDADLNLNQTLISDHLEGEETECYDARGYLSNVLFLERCGDNYWVVLNHAATFFREDDGKWGNLVLKFADDPVTPAVKRAYPVCVLAD